MTTEGDIDDKLGPLMDEFLSRKRKGEYPSLSEFVQRHPELETEIRELFPAVAMMEQAEVSEPSHAFSAPVTSDGQQLKRLGDFQIIREIGRGGSVFSAKRESRRRCTTAILCRCTVSAKRTDCIFSPCSTFTGRVWIQYSENCSSYDCWSQEGSEAMLQPNRRCCTIPAVA